MSGRVTDESRLLQPYSGKTIGEITIDRRQVFDPEASGSNAPPTRPTRLTRDVSSAATCFFEPGDTLDPELIVRNKQLIRSRGYIADIDIAVLPDAFDSTRVNLAITTRDSWTISG